MYWTASPEIETQELIENTLVISLPRALLARTSVPVVANFLPKSLIDTAHNAQHEHFQRVGLDHWNRSGHEQYVLSDA